MKQTVFIFTALFLLISTASAGDKELPSPAASVGVDLIKALEIRETERSYTGKAISLQDLSTILWAGAGISWKKSASSSLHGYDAVSGASKRDRRTYPTALGSDYMRLYVVDNEGVYSYAYDKLVFIQNSSPQMKNSLTHQNMSQAAYLLVLAVDLDKFPPTYRNRTQQLESGHASAGAIAQSIYLTATALGYGTVIMAYIKPEEIKKVLKLNDRIIPLYVMPLGTLK